MIKKLPSKACWLEASRDEKESDIVSIRMTGHCSRQERNFPRACARTSGETPRLTYSGQSDCLPLDSPLFHIPFHLASIMPCLARVLANKFPRSRVRISRKIFEHFMFIPCVTAGNNLWDRPFRPIPGDSTGLLPPISDPPVMHYGPAFILFGAETV